MGSRVYNCDGDMACHVNRNKIFFCVVYNMIFCACCSRNTILFSVACHLSSYQETIYYWYKGSANGLCTDLHPVNVLITPNTLVHNIPHCVILSTLSTVVTLSGEHQCHWRATQTRFSMFGLMLPLATSASQLTTQTSGNSGGRAMKR